MKMICVECIHNTVCGNKDRYKEILLERDKIMEMMKIESPKPVCTEFVAKKEDVKSDREEEAKFKEIAEFMKSLGLEQEDEDSCDCCNCGNCCEEEDDTEENLEKMAEELMNMIEEFIEEETPLDKFMLNFLSEEQIKMLKTKIAIEGLIEMLED